MRALGRAVTSTALVILSILVALLLLLLLDVAYTLLTAPDRGADPYDRQDNGWYQLKPGFTGTQTFGSETYDAFTDANGFRIAAPMGEAGTRPPAQVIFLGDSFTYGINGPWKDTFVGMYAQATEAPVINAGVASYSPTAYALQYRGGAGQGAACARASGGDRGGHQRRAGRSREMDRD